MWRKHRSVYQYHMKYVCNDILKPFKKNIPRYAERVGNMHDLAKDLPPPSTKGESIMSANWKFRNKEFMISDLGLAIKDGLTKPMRDELDDHPEDYISLTYEDWCELMSTIEVKYEMKRAAVQIKNIASARAAYLYDSEESVRISRRNKSKTGVLCSNKYSKRAHARYHGVNRYCVLCKKEGTNEQKYTSHSAEDCTGVRTKLPIKYGI